MEKTIIPVILLLILVGGGGAMWYLNQQDAEPDQQDSSSQNNVEDEEIEKVTKKEDDSNIAGGGLAMPPPGDNTKPVVEVGPEDVLSGTVTDEKGNPVPKTKIRALLLKKVPVPKVGRTRIDYVEEEVAITETDSKGYYEFRDDIAEYRGRKQLHLKSLNPEFTTTIKDHVGPGMIVNFELKRGGVIVGQVTDRKTGDPIADVRIDAQVKNNSASMHDYERWRERSVTDSQGRYRLTGAPTGKAFISLEHEDYEPSFIGQKQNVMTTVGKETEFNFTMQRGIVLDGLVIDAVTERPIKDAIVSHHELPFIPHLREKTGVRGKFKMKGISRGGHRLTIRAKGYTDYETNLDFNDEDMAGEVKFKLKPAGRARGLVLDENGDPMQNVKIFVAAQATIFFKIRDYHEALTDKDGRWEVGGLNDGKGYKVCGVYDGYTIGVAETVEGMTGEVIEDVIIQLQRGSTVQGQVIDQSGVAVAGATVALEKPPTADVWFPPGLGVGQKETLIAEADESGLFKFEGLYPGGYLVTVDHPEYIPVAGRRLKITSNNEQVSQDFELIRGRSISGSVVSAAGNPVKGATIEARIESGAPQVITATTDEEGRYKLTRLHDSAYRVFAKSDKAAGSAKQNVPAESTGVDFILEEYGGFEAKLIARDGTTPTRCTLKLLPLHDVPRKGGLYDTADRMSMKYMMGHEGFREEELVPARNGRIVVKNLIPGDYRLEISSEDFREFSRDVITIQPGIITNFQDFIIATGGRLEGFVRDNQGQPIVGKDIQIFLRAGPNSMKETVIVNGKPTTRNKRSRWPGKQAVTDANGFYSIGGLPPGQIEMLLRSPNYCVPAPEMLMLGETPLTKKDFRLTRGGQIVLHVKDENGAPVSNCTAQVTETDTGRVAKVDNRVVRGRGNTRGEVNITKIAPGRYTLRIHRPTYDTQLLEVEIASGQQIVEDVVLPSLTR